MSLLLPNSTTLFHIILFFTAHLLFPKLIEANPTKKEGIAIISSHYLIVIDPGHGGENSGAKHPNHLGKYEKDFTLVLAQKIAILLNEKGYQSLLTRESDRFIGLKERVQFANQKKADLFLSIHLNSSPQAGPKGHEFYSLIDTEIDESRIRLSLDIQSHPELLKQYFGISQSQYDQQSKDEQLAIEAALDLLHLSATDQSAILAQSLSQEMQKQAVIPNKGVKKKDFTVLMGAMMPTVVCEVGFINHPTEGLYITSTKGMDQISKLIAQGVDQFIKENLQ
jgi:N-acetylmuramoyl-L-alanine amidase